MYAFYNKLMKQHVKMHGEKTILLVQTNDGNYYEMLSNMNDYINLTEISMITDLRIGCKDIQNNIHYIWLPVHELKVVIEDLTKYNYTIIVNDIYSPDI